jgi:hypothetical protein
LAILKALYEFLHYQNTSFLISVPQPSFDCLSTFAKQLVLKAGYVVNLGALPYPGYIDKPAFNTLIISLYQPKYITKLTLKYL